MKKKALLNGFNAKIAFTVVALTGALLTGCYKDDGLDVNGPAGEVVLPNPVYTIAGNVVDAETFQPIASAAVSGDATATVVNGGFSVEVSTAKVYGMTVKAAGYEDTAVSVDVKAVKAGQSAVYSTLVAMQPKYEGKYTLKVVDTALGLLEAADWKVTTMAGAAATAPYAGGTTYLVAIEKTGYVKKYITVELPKIRTNTEKVINVTLAKQAVEFVKIYGEVKMNGKFVNTKSIKLLNADNKVLGIDEGYTYNFNVPTTEFAVKARTRAASETKTATFTFEIIDQSDRNITFKKVFDVVVSEDGSVESGDSEIDYPMNFFVNYNTPLVEANTAWNEVNNMVVDICNDEAEPLSFSFKYRSYTGAVSVESDYVAKMNQAGLLSSEDMYQSIVNSMTALQSPLNWTLADGTQTIPGRMLLKTMKITHKYEKVTVTLKNITLGDANGEVVTGDFATIFGAKNVIKRAISMPDFDVTDLYDISHSHSNNHGHGGNQNAGGGMIEAE